LEGLAAGLKYAKQMYYDEDLETFRHVESDGATMGDGFITRLTVEGDAGSKTVGQKDTVTFAGQNLVKTDATGDDVVVKIDETGATANQIIGYDGANVAWVDQIVRSILDSDTIDLALDGNGQLTASAKISATADNAIQNDSGLFAKQLKIAAGSADMLQIDGNYELSVKQLLITEPTVDAVSNDLAAALAANYANGDELQEGDVLIIVNEDSAYIHNGGNAGDATDFTQIKVPLAEGAIRALFSGGDGLAYNSATGQFDVDLAAADNDLSFDGGKLKVDVSAADVSDTNDHSGSGAGATVSLQSLIDAIQGKVDEKAVDTSVLHKAGEETATGKKIMSAGFEVSGGSFTSSRDFEVTDATKGYIAQDGSGQRYRFTVAAPGVWVSTAL
jgi:hypothetical protein